MHLSIETELEDDGRWIAEIPQLPGVLVYGSTEEEAAAKAEILALCVLAERLDAWRALSWSKPTSRDPTKILRTPSRASSCPPPRGR